MNSSVTRAAIEFGVVNYNGGSSLLKCVRSIVTQEGPECRVIVFDNASTDGSVDGLGELPGVEVIRSARNLGYAGALNRLVARMTAPTVVLCNMDLEFDAGWARAVESALEADPAADAVSTLVVEATDPPVINSVGVRFFADLHAQNVGSGEPYSVEAVSGHRGRAFGSYGAVMCFRRESLAGLEFDESYFLFFEETDFFLRFHLLGRRTAFADGAIARHERSLTTRRYSPLKLYYGERNRLTTVFKLLPVWYWPIAGVHTVRRLLTLALAAKGSGGRTSGEPGRGEAPDGATPATGEAAVVMPSTGVIAWTLLRAWAAAVLRLPGTLRKRWRFWAEAPGSPSDALALLREYELPAAGLRLR